MYFSDLPEGKRIREYGEEFLGRVLGGLSREEKVRYLDAYWEKARDFYVKSGFSLYLSSQASVYEAWLSSVQAQMPAFDVIRAHQDYHGAHGYRFTTVALPLALPSGGSYGPVIGGDVYNLMGRLPSRGDIKYLMLHEFGHPFCNPVVEKHAGLLEPHRGLFRGVERDMRAMAYGNWLTVVRETLVRAVHARLLLKHEGREPAERLVAEDKEAGFFLLEDFYFLLEEYEKDRVSYPTLYEFFPRLAAALDGWTLREVRETEKVGLVVNDWSYGAYVHSVKHGSPAQAAGLLAKDAIISLDGRPALAADLLALPAGRHTLKVVRPGAGLLTLKLRVRTLNLPRPVRKAGAPDAEKKSGA